MKTRSLVLLSGGLDSAANLALCVARDEAVLALTFDYGQKAAKREIQAARDFCRYYSVKHQEVEISWLGKLGGNSLTDVSQAVPTLRADCLDDLAVTRGTAQQVWVPNRNGVLLNCAAAFAERLGVSRIVVGFNREEAATFPDNSLAFMKAETQALSFSTANQVTVFSYTVEWNKAETVKEMRKLKPAFPFNQIWSCYQGEKDPCGVCESCLRLRRALQ